MPTFYPKITPKEFLDLGDSGLILMDEIALISNLEGTDDQGNKSKVVLKNSGYEYRSKKSAKTLSRHYKYYLKFIKNAPEDVRVQYLMGPDNKQVS